MRKVLSTILRAAAVASLVCSSTGAADLAALAGAGPGPAMHVLPARLAPAVHVPPPAGPSFPRRVLSALTELLSFIAPAKNEPRFDRSAFLVMPERPAKVEPPRDRIMVVKEKRLVAALSPLRGTRAEGRWIESSGLRFRLNYLRVRKERQVTGELELENTRPTELRGLYAGARQESYNGTGKKGCPLGLAMKAGSAAVLAPGARTVVRYSFSLSGARAERTHLIISGEGETLADELEAGVIGR